MRHHGEYSFKTSKNGIWFFTISINFEVKKVILIKRQFFSMKYVNINLTIIIAYPFKWGSYSVYLINYNWPLGDLWGQNIYFGSYVIFKSLFLLQLPTILAINNVCILKLIVLSHKHLITYNWPLCDLEDKIYILDHMLFLIVCSYCNCLQFKP